MVNENISRVWNERWQKELLKKFNLNDFGIFVKDILLLSKNLLSNLPLQKGSKILDIGGATGRNLQFYFGDWDKNFEFFIVDISKEALKIAENRGYKTFCINIEITQLPFLDNTFDLVIIQEVIEHLYNYETIFKEIQRVLKPFGFIFLTTPNIVSLLDRLRVILGYKPSCMLFDDTHIRFFTHSEIENLFDKYNFKVIFSGTQGIYFPVRFLKFKKYIKIPFFHTFAKNLGQHIVILGEKLNK